LASTIDKKFIYLDFIHTPYSELDKLYEDNKDIDKTIIFDNYIDLISNSRRMNLFMQNRKFTIIFVVNYISKKIILKTDRIYFAKNKSECIINSYFNSIQKYYKNKKKFISSIKKIKNYGFICLDKDNRYKYEEELIELK
jgi:hypothetical protein